MSWTRAGEFKGWLFYSVAGGNSLLTSKFVLYLYKIYFFPGASQMMLSHNAVSLPLAVWCPSAAIPHQSFCLFLKLQFLEVFYPFDFWILWTLHPADPTFLPLLDFSSQVSWFLRARPSNPAALAAVACCSSFSAHIVLIAPIKVILTSFA